MFPGHICDHYPHSPHAPDGRRRTTGILGVGGAKWRILGTSRREVVTYR